MRDSTFYELDLDLDIDIGFEDYKKKQLESFDLKKCELKDAVKKLRNLFVAKGMANLNNDEKNIYLTNNALAVKVNGKNIEYSLKLPQGIIFEDKSFYSNFISGMCYTNKTHVKKQKNIKRVDFGVKLNDEVFCLVVEYSCEIEPIIFETNKNGIEYYLITDSNSFFVPKCITLCFNKEIFETINLVLPKINKKNESDFLEVLLEKDCIIEMVKSEEKKFLNERESILIDYFRFCGNLKMKEFTSVEKILLNDELIETFEISENTFLKVKVFVQKKSFQKYIGPYLISGKVNKKFIKLILVSEDVEKQINEFSFMCFEEIFDIDNFIKNCKIY